MPLITGNSIQPHPQVGRPQVKNQNGATSAERAKIAEVSEEFEAIFLEIMLKAMRDSVPKSGFIDGGNAEDIYRGMLDSEYAKQMAAQRTGGLASAIEKHLLGLIENQTKTQTSRAGRQAYGAEGLQSLNKQATIEADAASLMLRHDGK